jgi:formate-dependent nitrite reductase membrane component NrfD
LPLAIGVALYTGLLLSGSGYLNLAASKGADGHPLWSRSHLPLMFLTSGISAGIALTGFNMLWVYKAFGNEAVVRLWWWPRTIFKKIPGISTLLRPVSIEQDLRGMTWEEVVRVVRVLSLAVVVTIAFEAWDIYVYLSHLSSGNPGTQLAHKMLTTGPLSTLFWGGVITLGLAIPLLITPLETMFKAHAVRLQYVKFCSILIGGLIFRYVIVINGALSKAPLKFPGIPPSGPPIF